MEKWHPRTQIRINLSAIKNVIVLAEEGIVDFEKRRRRRLSFWEEWKGEGEGESRDWEPIRVLKTRLKEFEKRGSSFDAFKNSEFVEKVKSSLVCAYSSSSDLLGFNCIILFPSVFLLLLLPPLVSGFITKIWVGVFIVA